MKRREFLVKTSAAGFMIGATPFLNLSCGVQNLRRSAGPQRLEKVGLQLYTLGDQMTEDFEGTLEQIAAAGYDQVEFAGYFDHTPEEARAQLDRLSLTSPANHSGNLLTDDSLAEAIEAAEVIGHEYLIAPTLPKELIFVEPEMAEGEEVSEDAEAPSIFDMVQWPTYTSTEIREIAADYNRIGEVCRQSGFKFAFHNHWAEFDELEDGGILYDLLLDETDPDLVFFELDLGWAIAGGADPLAYFARDPGRFHLFHVKDITEAKSPCVVGEGIINFAPILAQSRQAGVKYYIVEQDMPPDPIANVTASVQNLKSMTF